MDLFAMKHSSYYFTIHLNGRLVWSLRALAQPSGGEFLLMNSSQTITIPNL